MKPPIRRAPWQAVRTLLGRDDLPAWFSSRFEAEERVLAVATMPGDGPRNAVGHCVATTWGLWIPGEDGPRRVGWHLITKAVWGDSVFRLVEAREVEDLGGAVLLADRDLQIVRLVEPGRVPETVQQRVSASIRSRHHRDLPGGGAWFVQRKVPGRDGFVLQVRPDPGTDPAAVRQVAADAARTLGLA
jgi:hypothetical protein